MANRNPPKRRTRHTKEDCACRACTLMRTKEANTLAAGDGGLSVEPERSVGRPKRNRGSLKNIEPIHVIAKSPRDRIAEWAMLRAAEPGIKNVEVARRLGIQPNSLNKLISDATREGWLVFDDPVDSIDFQIIPKVMKNLNTLLDDVDRTTTLETAKGTIFRTYQNSKGISDNIQAVLTLNVAAVPLENARPIEGQVVGKPRLLEE